MSQPAQTKKKRPLKNDPSSSKIHEAEQRAERAEQQLAELRDTVASLKTEHAQQSEPQPASGNKSNIEPTDDGLDQLRKDSMMSHLFDSLDAGKDIGHYGRLVFAMVAHHFLSDQAVIDWLTKDRDFTPEAATLMLRQVEGRDYNPPRRERILQWQAEQEFPILPDASDPDCGNVYRNLKFPNQVYEHIQNYQEEKVEAEA